MSQAQRLKPFIAASLAALVVVGCSDSNNTTSGTLDTTAAKCFTGYVDGYTGLTNAYQGVAESQDKAEWGKNHYESHGYKEGRALPDGCVAYLKNTDETWAAYVDSYPDLKAAYEAQKASLAKTPELQKKARFGENHYKSAGYKSNRSLPKGASTLGLGNSKPKGKKKGAEPAAESGGAVAETLPTVSLACATASISEDGGTSECTLTLSKTYSQAVTVTVAYSGSATAGTDYSGNTTSHTISAGSTTTSWTITGLNDNSGGGGGDNGESDETIVIDIASVTNGTEQNTQTASISLPNVCIAPGTAITDANFSAAITDWFASPSGASATYGNITQWCTGAVTDMSNALGDYLCTFSWYSGAKCSFNEDISGWDVSNVTDMSDLFTGVPFNQDISGWDVGNVRNMSNLFNGNTAFNQNIGGWNTSNVTNMSNMFAGTSFNQNIGGWNTSNVTNMSFMFNSSPFNQNIGNWTTSSLTTTYGMFSDASSFNQDISSWNVSNVTSMGYMFQRATSFNKNLSAWNVSKVTASGYCDNMSNLASSWIDAYKPGQTAGHPCNGE